MKTLKGNYWLLTLLLGLMVVLVSCEEDDDGMMENPGNGGNSITEIAASNANFSVLVAALSRVGLDDDLAGNGSYTVFAPTNAAFTALLNELKLESLDDIEDDVLKQVLLYHVLTGSSKTTVLQSGYYSSLAPGPIDGYTLSLLFDGNTAMLNARANIVQTDIEADNGVIHVIDKVLLPMSITDQAIANPEFTSLVAAVSKAELAAILDDDGASFTVFAPTNNALSAFLADNELNFDDLTKEDLSPILLYHVLGSVVPSSMVEPGYVSTMASAFNNNVSLKIEIDNDILINSIANVIAKDVVATNGIIHVIDRVITLPSVVDIAMKNSDFSILVDALVKADLVGALSAEGPFTIFAPTNTAFTALFAALGVSGLEELSVEDLTPVLLAHVASGNAVSSNLSNGTIPTLNSEKNLLINVGQMVTIDGEINVVATDIQGTNGVIHVIDKVIVP